MNLLIDGHDVTLVGGIERFTAKIANAMARRKHTVFLFTYAPQGSCPFCALDPNVILVHYLFTGSQAHIPGLRRQILTCEPDVFVSPASYNNHLLWCATLAGTGIPWVYSEHSDPQIIINERWSAEERSAALCTADRIHLLLENHYSSIPDVVRERVRVIPHAVNIPAAADKTKQDESLTLLSLGRLSAPKQINVLLDAFALLAPDFPQWRLEIWGEGEERLRLQRQIDCLGLQKKARLCGPTRTPEKQYAADDLFCIPSRYEGFGCTVIEAMAGGLPVVGFAGCTALSGIIRPGETGLLAPEMTARSLAESLRSLMKNADLRRCMGEKARAAAAKYAPRRVFDAWEELLQETAACKGRTALQRCLADDTNDPEVVEHVALLREVLHRKNVLLRDDQRLRRLVRRYPGIGAMLRPLRRCLRRL
jgi:glycosyltransferase involved in cell wall biosynthesis